MKLRAIDIANYFVLLSDGGDITNLKAQKLVYFAYGHYLAKYNESLFEEAIEAWDYGPVIRDLYEVFKPYKARPLPLADSFDANIISEEIRKFLQNIYLSYGEYKAKDLCDLSHIRHSPWYVVYNDDSCNDLINDDLIHAYFSELQLISSQKITNHIEVAKLLSQDKSLAETMHILTNPLNAKKLSDALDASPDDSVEIDWKND